MKTYITHCRGGKRAAIISDAALRVNALQAIAMVSDYKVLFYSPTNLHNAYKHMVANPPENFRYIEQEYMATPLTRASGKGRLKNLLEKVRWAISPHYNYFLVATGNPKIRKFYSNDYDLIHSTQSPLETNLPYVMDFEHATVLAGYNQIAFSNQRFVRNLKNILENDKLKKLTPWSKAAKFSLLNFLSSREIEEKIEVVYPVITPPDKIPEKNGKREGDRISILFVGGNFYEKGGLETLMAFDKISAKYDAHLTMVSGVPDAIKARFAKNPKITITARLPYPEVQKLYNQSHFFLMPTHMDTFAYVIIEALSYGLPVVTDDSFSRPELVENEKSGLVVKSYYSCFGPRGEYIYPTNSELYRKRKLACMNPPDWYVNELAKAMERLILDSRLRKLCSKNARLECTQGKFSPKTWKEKMGRIYREAIS